MYRLTRVFRERAAVRQAGGLVLGGLAGQAILVLTTPLITRLYSPVDYGVLAAYSALIMPLSIVATLRLELALLMARSDEEADHLTRSGQSLALFMSLIATAVILGVAHWMNPVFLQPLKPYIPPLFVGVALLGSFQLLTFRLTRKKKYRGQVYSRTLQPIVQIASQILFGFLRVGSIGLILGQIVGYIAANLLLLRGLKPQWVPLRHIGAVVKQYREFPLYVMPSALIRDLGTHLPVLLTTSLYSIKETGLLALGMRIISTPVSLACSSVGQVYLGRASEYRQSAAALRNLTWRTAKSLFLIGVAPTIALIAFAPALFAIFFGEEWREAGGYMRIMAPLFLMRFVFAPISQVLLLAQRAKLQLFWGILKAFVVSGSFALARILDWSYPQALVGYTIVETFSFVLLFILIARSVNSLVEEGNRAPRGE